MKLQVGADVEIDYVPYQDRESLGQTGMQSEEASNTSQIYKYQVLDLPSSIIK